MIDQSEFELAPPGDMNSASLADWIELALLAEGRRFISPAKALTLLEQKGGVANETDVAFAFGVLHDRSDLGLSRYPFVFTRLGIERTVAEPSQSPYVFLLLLANFASHIVPIDSNSMEAGAPILERLVTAALPGIFGPRVSAIRFGWPPEAGRPGAFDEAIRWLARHLGARTLELRGTAGGRADGGIDVVAWWDHGDQRAAGPIGVVQVTYEQDLRRKSIEIAAADLDRWIEIPPPVPILATPFDLTSDPDLFSELSTRAVIVDRWRILRGLDTTAPDGSEVGLWIETAVSWRSASVS